MSGIASPTLTKAGRVVVKLRTAGRAAIAVRRKKVCDIMIAVLKYMGMKSVDWVVMAFVMI